MRRVADQTGLSPHVLRVWERRYGAVRPERSESNRRLYSQEEIDRLKLLARLTAEGHGIGLVATLPRSELEELAGGPVVPPQAPGGEAAGLLEEAWSQVRQLDPRALRDTLERASVSLGVPGLNHGLIVPLIARIGTAWEQGELSVAEEHAASSVIKEVLFLTSRPFAASASGPNLVVATPDGQLHELGAALVASTARSQGWEVTYLGASLPASEIARAAMRHESRAVALSVVYPGDDPQLPGELETLRRCLPGEAAILVGGRAAGDYIAALRRVGATLVPDLPALIGELAKLRRVEAA